MAYDVLDRLCWSVIIEKKFKCTRLTSVYICYNIGANDLALAPSEVVGSDIEELVRSLVPVYSVRAMILCQVTPRATKKSSDFNEKAKLLNKYTRVVIKNKEQAIFWTLRGLWNPSVTPFSSDGVHFNPMHGIIYMVQELPRSDKACNRNNTARR